VRTVYLDRAGQAPERYRIIDAAQPVEKVRAAVEHLLTEWLERG